MPLPYDGAILIARSDPKPKRPLMGCLQAWDFECVWKLSFRSGAAGRERDVSRHIEMQRTRYGIDGEFYNIHVSWDEANEDPKRIPYRLRNARRYLARHLGLDLRIAC